MPRTRRPLPRRPGQTPLTRRYLVLRNCCTSGNCFRCMHKTPFGVPLSGIFQFETDDPKLAAQVARNWAAYKAEVVDRHSC